MKSGLGIRHPGLHSAFIVSCDAVSLVVTSGPGSSTRVTATKPQPGPSLDCLWLQRQKWRRPPQRVRLPFPEEDPFVLRAVGLATALATLPLRGHPHSASSLLCSCLLRSGCSWCVGATETKGRTPSTRPILDGLFCCCAWSSSGGLHSSCFYLWLRSLDFSPQQQAVGRRPLSLSRGPRELQEAAQRHRLSV